MVKLMNKNTIFYNIMLHNNYTPSLSCINHSGQIFETLCLVVKQLLSVNVYVYTCKLDSKLHRSLYVYIYVWEVSE